MIKMLIFFTFPLTMFTNVTFWAVVCTFSDLFYMINDVFYNLVFLLRQWIATPKYTPLGSDLISSENNEITQK